MSDIFSKEKRTIIMSKISGKNTKPEILVRKYLFAHGFRFRVNDKRLPGKPDILLPKYKSVIFVNGCFWHGHENCKALLFQVQMLITGEIKYRQMLNEIKNSKCN